MTTEMKQRIDSLSREQMARKWRFSAGGDSMFQGEVGDYFFKRFRDLGGWSPTLSKKIGW